MAISQQFFKILRLQENSFENAQIQAGSQAAKSDYDVDEVWQRL